MRTSADLKSKGERRGAVVRCSGERSGGPAGLRGMKAISLYVGCSECEVKQGKDNKRGRN